MNIEVGDLVTIKSECSMINKVPLYWLGLVTRIEEPTERHSKIERLIYVLWCGDSAGIYRNKNMPFDYESNFSLVSKAAKKKKQRGS